MDKTSMIFHTWWLQHQDFICNCGTRINDKDTAYVHYLDECFRIQANEPSTAPLLKKEPLHQFYMKQRSDGCDVLNIVQKVDSLTNPQEGGCMVKKSSQVMHPNHYTRGKGKIEVIEAIEDWELTFSEANVVKYVVRAPLKDKLLDLQKGKRYLVRLIALEKQRQHLDLTLEEEDVLHKCNSLEEEDDE